MIGRKTNGSQAGVVLMNGRKTNGSQAGLERTNGMSQAGGISRDGNMINGKVVVGVKMTS